VLIPHLLKNYLQHKLLYSINFISHKLFFSQFELFNPFHFHNLVMLHYHITFMLFILFLQGKLLSVSLLHTIIQMYNKKLTGVNKYYPMHRNILLIMYLIQLLKLANYKIYLHHN